MWHDSFICMWNNQSLHEIARFRLAATCNACYSFKERLGKMLQHWERWETPQCVDSYEWLIHVWLTQWDDSFIRDLLVWLWRVRVSTYERVISLGESHMNNSDESHMNESSHWVSHIWIIRMSHIWMSHLTGRVTYEWFGWVTYEWVISLGESHMNNSDESHMNESSHWSEWHMSKWSHCFSPGCNTV